MLQSKKSTFKTYSFDSLRLFRLNCSMTNKNAFKTFMLLMLVGNFAQAYFNFTLVKNTALKNGIPPGQADRLLNYIRNNENNLRNKNYVTFVDFRQPSSKKRGLMINANNGSAYSFLVAHGINSGAKLYASTFSNIIDSKQSSLGIYRVENDYYGTFGHSLRVEGLERTNSNAKNRAIVIHPYSSVSEETIQNIGMIGTTYGCFGLNPEVSNYMVPLLKNGSLLLAFY